jgi:uncharacterized protein YaaQ
MHDLDIQKIVEAMEKEFHFKEMQDDIKILQSDMRQVKIGVQENTESIDELARIIHEQCDKLQKRFSPIEEKVINSKKILSYNLSSLRRQGS